MMKTLKMMTVVAIGAMVAAFFAAVLIVSAAPRVAVDDPFDAAGTYKKCVACHGPKAEKKFDATKSDADLAQAVLNGKTMEKPPNMPGYAAKGITEDQAKALVAFMKSLGH